MTFVLLSPRSGAEVLAAEYADFLSYSGLTPAELEQRPLDNPDADLGSFDGMEGVFIGGSPFTITRPVDVEWQEAISQKLVEFLQVESERQRFGIFSTCYGTSMLAHYLDGEVNSLYSESAGTSEVSLTDAGRVDPITGTLPDRFTALTGHKDSVVRVPEEATLLATGETCPVQIYRYRENVWTSQFHPENHPATQLLRGRGLLRPSGDRGDLRPLRGAGYGGGELTIGALCGALPQLAGDGELAGWARPARRSPCTHRSTGLPRRRGARSPARAPGPSPRPGRG